MIQIPPALPIPERQEPLQQAVNEVNTSYNCMGRCRDVSFAISGIFLAFQSADYYVSGKTYSAIFSAASFCLVGSSYYIVRKYGDIHVITRALQVALQRLAISSREVLVATASIRNTAETLDPIATNVINSIATFQTSVQSLVSSASRMEEGQANVEELIRILDEYSAGGAL